MDVRITYDVPVPMRDGVVLRADVFRPDAPGRWPVILRRTPYDKASSVGGWGFADAAARRGYIVVVQDCRGRYQSEGEFEPFVADVADGYDTVEWAAAQEWSDGQVGLVGNSYNGATQWLAALQAPPHLTCMFPAFTSAEYYGGWVYKGGAFFLAFSYAWALEFLALGQLEREHMPEAEATAERQRLLVSLESLRRTLTRPPAHGRKLLERLAPYYKTWLEHPAEDAYWRSFSLAEAYPRIHVPSFNMGGWYDLFREGPTRSYAGLCTVAASEAERSSHRLLMGPWTHSNAASGTAGQRSFGPSARVSLEALQWQWLDGWLKGKRDELPLFRQPPVQLFVMGANRWRGAHEWPPAGSEIVPYYLHSNGRANSIAGDGGLSTTEPAQEHPDHYLHNPLDPVPTLGTAGVYDQQSVEERRDVLIYTSGPLVTPIEVTGDVRADLFFASTGTDTDVVVKLVDVSERGYAANVAEGVLRLRYRNSFALPEPLEPGIPYRIAVDLGPISNTFLPGHRIRIEVASSHFPRFDVNFNDLSTDRAAMAGPAVTQTLLHDREHPSRILLPAMREPLLPL